MHLRVKNDVRQMPKRRTRTSDPEHVTRDGDGGQATWLGSRSGVGIANTSSSPSLSFCRCLCYSLHGV